MLAGVMVNDVENRPPSQSTIDGKYKRQENGVHEELADNLLHK